MTIDITFLSRCIDKLEAGVRGVESAAAADVDFYCHVIIDQFEIVLEQSGKLLRKLLLPYFHAKKAVDNLTYNDVFRHAGHHGILDMEEVERWLQCRRHCDTTIDDNTEFYNAISALLPQFIIDARALAAEIEKQNVVA